MVRPCSCPFPSQPRGLSPLPHSFEPCIPSVVGSRPPAPDIEDGCDHFPHPVSPPTEKITDADSPSATKSTLRRSDEAGPIVSSMRLHRVTHQIGKFREQQWPAGHTEAEKASTPPTASFRPFGPDTVMRTAQGGRRDSFIEQA